MSTANKLKLNDNLFLLRQRLSRGNILCILQRYGFIECAYLISFLEYVCDNDELDRDAYSYIYAKIRKCLSINAADTFGNCNDSYYFYDLEVLRNELEFILSIEDEFFDA